MAAVDMFLKLNGVDGESPDTKHPGEIQLDGFRLHGSSPLERMTGGKEGKGAVKLANFTCFSKVDKATPLLFARLCTNDVIPTAILTCRKAGKEQFEYFKVTLTDVLIMKVEARCGEGDEEVVPRCEFDLAYGKIEVEYREQTPKGPTTGTVKFMFDLRKNV